MQNLNNFHLTVQFQPHNSGAIQKSLSNPSPKLLPKPQTLHHIKFHPQNPNPINQKAISLTSRSIKKNKHFTTIIKLFKNLLLTHIKKLYFT
jgi:hypothetical protein